MQFLFQLRYFKYNNYVFSCNYKTNFFNAYYYKLMRVITNNVDNRLNNIALYGFTC